MQTTFIEIYFKNSLFLKLTNEHYLTMLRRKQWSRNNTFVKNKTNQIDFTRKSIND